MELSDTLSSQHGVQDMMAGCFWGSLLLRDEMRGLCVYLLPFMYAYLGGIRGLRCV